MMVKQGWMGDDFDFNTLKDYDFTTFTDYDRSVVRFKDMDNKLMTRLACLFTTYSYWPVKLYPLIDYVKRNDDDFAAILFENLQRLTYYKKFSEFPPEETVSTKPPSIEIEEALQAGSLLDEPIAVEFVTLLAELWVGKGLDRLTSILSLIVTGELKPEISIPEDPEELTEWLDVSVEDDVVRRQIRSKSRNIAKKNSTTYLSGEQSVDYPYKP
jgi:hypothetical protein